MNIIIKRFGQGLSMKAKKLCLHVLAVITVSLAFSASARADCTGFWPSEEMWCFAPGSWDPNQPLNVMVGSDPYDSNSHWIGWQNQTTGECHWDQIGSSNTGELGGWNPQQNRYVHIDRLLVRANYGNDEIFITDDWIHHCGFWLTPVVFHEPDFNAVSIDGDEGNDSISVGSNGNRFRLYGYSGDDTIFSRKADAYIDGDSGNDTIIVFGQQGGGFYWGSHDNDMVLYFGTNPSNLSGCGSGNDTWLGPGTRPADCEF